MTTKKIGLIRHGETEWNHLGKAQGHSDIPLNDLGRKQAKLLGKRLALENWERIYSSDLLRAKETAEIIATYTKLPHLTDRRLRERHGGLIEGTTETERVNKWGEHWRHLDLRIESGEKMSERGLSFIEEILLENRSNNFLIVSHGAFLKQLLRTLVPTENVEQSLANCSLTILHLNEQTYHLQLHNCTKHMTI